MSLINGIINGAMQGIQALTAAKGPDQGNMAGLAARQAADPGEGPGNMADLFGNNALEKDVDGGDRKAKGKAAAGAAKGGGDIKSLGELLAIVGSSLTKSMENTMNELADAAKQLDAMQGGGQGGQGGGPTAAQNQKIQELTFNLQQMQQSLNRVNETATNLSKSQSDAQKSTTQNLAV
jgi:hypothetical protein